MNVRNFGGGLRLGSWVAAWVAAGVAVAPAGARAQCTIGTCNVTSCDFNCPTSNDYLIFGNIWRQDAPGGGYYSAGYGVCRFASDGSWSQGAYQDYTATQTDTGDYRIRADGANGSYGGNDVLRMGDYDGEWCRAPGAVYAVFVVGDLSGTDGYLFWGDRGNDELSLCRDRAGYETNCDANMGRADGRSGDDDIYGKYRSETDLWGGFELTGQTDNDEIYANQGNDTVHAGPGTDHVWGGYGDDTLYGEAGTDYLYGNEDFDQLFGGTGNDPELIGGSERDFIYGMEGNDTLKGGLGDDLLIGGDGGDNLAGEAGYDTLYAETTVGGDGDGWDNCYCGSMGGGGDTYLCADPLCDSETCTYICDYGEGFIDDPPVTDSPEAQPPAGTDDAPDGG